jgi:hypothetical protein
MKTCNKASGVCHVPIPRSSKDLYSDAHSGFLRCKKNLQNGEGGKVRSGKGGKCDIWESLFLHIILNIIKSLGLPYKVFTNYRVPLQGGQSSPKVDIVITDWRGAIIYCIEVKDYNDITMHRGVACMMFNIRQQHPNTKFIILSGHVASTSEKQNFQNENLGLESVTYCDTLLSLKRKSDNPLFLLDFEESVIVDHINELTSRLTSYLSQELE